MVDDGDAAPVRRDGVGAVTGIAPADAAWWVLLPIKSTAVGKSRIALEPRRRARVARAMALDTAAAVAAARRVDRVLALVDDEADGAALAAIGGVDAHVSTVSGLNESILAALALPGMSDRAVAVLPADLPSLLPAELDLALRAAARVPLAVVADRQGTGTTLLAARIGRELPPRYGPGSFVAHCRAGAVPLAVPVGSGLRRDVDVVADLRGVTGQLTRAEVGDLAAESATG